MRSSPKGHVMATRDMSSLSHSVCFHFFLLFLWDGGIALKSMTLSFFLVILFRDIYEKIFRSIRLSTFTQVFEKIKGGRGRFNWQIIVSEQKIELSKFF
jgi:hypothetical protein